jgi:undecaprenyl-diphosphatase
MKASVTDLVRGMKDLRWAVAPAIVVAICAFGLVAFLEIGHEVGEDVVLEFDRTLLLALRDPADVSNPIGPPWFEEAVLEMTALGGFTLIITVLLAVVGYLIVAGFGGPALFLMLSVFTGWLASQSLKSYYARPRPDLVAQLDLVHTASFPSGHAMMTTLVYLTLATVIARVVDRTAVRVYVFATAIVISVLVGLTRIYLGVHWPSDVLAGWALGAAWAALSWLVASALRYRRQQLRSRGEPV